MFNHPAQTFCLDNFEGPLELLLFLIQKEEVDVCSITIKKLTEQLIKSLETSLAVETTSETLTVAATLLLIKSRKLLPQEASLSEEIEEDIRVELIQSLIEYCHFKEAAKTLSLREEEQKAHFSRAITPFRKELGPGLEEISIDQLKNILGDLLKRSSQIPKQLIKEEEWHVSSKLELLREELAHNKKISLSYLFAQTGSRKELIVIFLALLELMKHQEAKIVKENENLYIIDYAPRT